MFYTYICKAVDINQFKETKQDKSKDTKYLSLWNALGKKHLKQSGSASNPPDSGSDFITQPELYESDYDRVEGKAITGWNLNYFTMDQFSDGGVCYPTVATNLCFYWYNRDTTKYKNLKDSSGWQGTFNKFFSLMGTDKQDGTYDSKCASAYESYFKSKGLSCSASIGYSTGYGAVVEEELDKDIPCQVMVHGHYMYGDHGVLAVGYRNYIYKTLIFESYSRYIRIADGWANGCPRFIWGDCDGYWNLIRVNPN